MCNLYSISTLFNNRSTLIYCEVSNMTLFQFVNPVNWTLTCIMIYNTGISTLYGVINRHANMLKRISTFDRDLNRK